MVNTYTLKSIINLRVECSKHFFYTLFCFCFLIMMCSTFEFDDSHRGNKNTQRGLLCFFFNNKAFSTINVKTLIHL